MRDVFLKILGFVILIDLFYMGIGRLYLTQSEEHPPAELQIGVETDQDTLLVMGEALLKNKGGCLLCHKMADVGNTRGPDLRGVGGRAASRRPGMSAEAYLIESLVNPGAYVVEAFATPGGESIMPAADRPPADMSATEIKALVAFLQSQNGEITVTVTEQDVASAAARNEVKPAPAPSHPGFALMTSKGCVACHDPLAETRRIGPPLVSVGTRLSADDIRQSIVDPNAVIAEGYPPGLMLQTFGETLTSEELNQLVSYLSGEVGLAERLAHPGIHLLILIILFNGGVAWGVRKAENLGRPPWSPGPHVSDSAAVWLGILGSPALIIALYWSLQSRPPESTMADIQAEITETKVVGMPLAPTNVGAQAKPIVPDAVHAGSELDGAALYKVTCPACHGAGGKGVPGLGKDMTTSPFVDRLSDAELVDFISRGRAVGDPQNTTGIAMPPKGLNNELTDDELMAIVQFIRSLKE